MQAVFPVERTHPGVRGIGLSGWIAQMKELPGLLQRRQIYQYSQRSIRGHPMRGQVPQDSGSARAYHLPRRPAR